MHKSQFLPSLLIALISLALLLPACSSPESGGNTAAPTGNFDQIVVGNWQDENSELSFVANGQLSVTWEGGTKSQGLWEVANDTILKLKFPGTTDVYKVTRYSQDEFAFKLVEGDPTVFIAKRQKNSE